MKTCNCPDRCEHELDYLIKMSKDGCYGGEHEIVAFSLRYNAKVTVFQPGQQPLVYNENSNSGKMNPFPKIKLSIV